MNLPNIISIGRLCAAPLIVWLVLSDQIAIAFWVFLAASISDGIDGYVAKRFNRVTVLGSYLDPIADKALLVGVYISFGHAGYLELWLVILIVFRDLLIVGGVLLFRLFTSVLPMPPLPVSKINTVAQIVLASTVLAANGLDLSLELVVAILIYVVAITTVMSGTIYLINGSRRIAGLESM